MRYGGLALARIVEVRSEAHGVDVVLLEDGRRLSGVQVLARRAGGNFGAYGFGIPTETGYDAKTSGVRDVFGVIGWAGNDHPVLLGFLFPQKSQMLFEEDKEREIARHPSDIYSNIDKDANYEMRHPSGAYVRIAVDPAHEDLTKKDYREKWEIKNNVDKQVHIHAQQKDGKAWVDIDPDGNIVVHAPVVYVEAPKVIITGNVTIEGSLHVVGKIGSEADVVAGDGDVSLLEHKHKDVEPGQGQTGDPTGGAGMPSKGEFTMDSHLPAKG